MPGAEWTRIHLIGKDSQRAPLGIYLTHGVTGLLFLLLNEGKSLGAGLDVEDPVQALRAVSSDPWLRTRVRLWMACENVPSGDELSL